MVRYYMKKIITGLFLIIMCAAFARPAGSKAASTIEISTAAQLAQIGTSSQYPMNGDYVLTKDIDLSGQDWIPIGGKGKTNNLENYIGIRGDSDHSSANVFSGTFDGKGHVISGMTIDLSGSASGSGSRNCAQVGLFSIIGSDSSNKTAEVKNLIFENVDIRADFSGGFAAIGTLAGEVNGYTKIDNISAVNGTITGNTTSACDTVGIGGIIGECRTTISGGNSNIYITNIYNGVDVNASGTRHDILYSAGIVGRIAKSKIGKVSGCLNVGSIQYDGYMNYAVTSPELGNTDYVANISNCYYLEDSSYIISQEATVMSKASLTSGTLPSKLDSGVWKAVKGCYPVPKICLDSKAAGNIYLAGLELSYASGESALGVKSAVNLPSSVGGYDLTWTSSSDKVVHIDGNRAVPDRSEIGSDTPVVLTATTAGGYKKDFKITVIPEVYIKAYFENSYAEVGKPLKVKVDYNKAGATFTYNWKVNGVNVGSNSASYTPKKEDLESVISVEVKADNTEMRWEVSLYFSELPVIYIDTDDGAEITSNYNYKGADIKVQGNNEFSDVKNMYEGRTTIKGRGNSTWSQAVAFGVKKPYKLKLESKSNLLGLSENGKNKHWVLLANMIDHTNMRNEITHNFSKDMGLEYAMASTSVVLILNGGYEGVYQLSEHVRIGKSRINVYDWEGLAETIAEAICKENLFLVQDNLEEAMCEDLSFITTGVVNYGGNKYKVSDYFGGEIPAITGGYLLGMDFRSPHDKNKYPSSFISSNTIPMYVDSPEFAVSCPAMMDYVENYVNAFESAIKSRDWLCDYMGMDCHYSDLYDLDSLVAYWFVCEITNNWDSMKNSTYMYKDIDSKIFMGPAWDYDWGYGNICMYSSSQLLNYTEWQTTLTGRSPSQGGFAEQEYQKYQWNRYLVKDPYFVLKLYNKYKSTRNTVFEGLIKDGGVIDTLAEKYRRASEANDDKWSWSYSKYHGDAFIDGVVRRVDSQLFDPAVYSFKTFVEKRIEWFDTQFKDINTLYTSLGNTISGDNKVTVKKDGNKVTVTLDAGKDTAKYVEFIVNGRRIETAEGAYLYNIENKKASIEVPENLINREDDSNIVQAVVYNKDYVIDDKAASYAVFDFDSSALNTPAPTKTPRPSDVPAPTTYPFPDKTPSPTPRPTKAPTVTKEPTSTKAPDEGTDIVPTTVPSGDNGQAKDQAGYASPTPAPAGKSGLSGQGTSDNAGTDKTGDVSKKKAGLSITGKKTVKCGGKIKLKAVKKNLKGKVTWSVAAKYKKKVKLSRKTGDSVNVTAGKSKGKAVITAVCKKCKAKFTVKIK